MNIELINYKNKHAKGVAKMWNESAECWGGFSSLITEEGTINAEENSTHLDLVLAKESDEIIGYCKLSIDHHDEGALYIDLINVRPDYHGKSIGKMLLLDAIDKTIQRGWRRLDLFTWSGNTKAVPLYKKCGFFWEKRENTTHLINLIPDVLKCELVSDFFKTADWYKDSTREIQQQPDSRLVNEFDLWNYEWEKDGKKLNMEYSRRGRGLRKIENDDFIIEVVIENMKLIFGDTYKVKYLFKNKTDQPLNINIEGCKDKNIQFDFKTEFELIDTEEIEASFFVDKIEKKQEENKTHPVVKSIISVNDKKATFQTGVEPVFPLTFKFDSERMINKLDVETDCYIDIDNQFREKATFSFEIPNTEAFNLSKNTFTIELEAGEKASLESSFILEEATMYNRVIKILVQREGKSDFTFEKSLHIVCQADYGKLHGENDERYVMANGEMRVELIKENNEIVITQYRTGNYYEVVAPKLGKPFSQEFEKKKASRVEFESKNDWIQMVVYYESEENPGIDFKRYYKLHANGVVKRWFEVSNNGSEDKALCISESMYLDADSMIAPYNNKFISLENETSSDPEILEGSKFTENWLYTTTKDYTYGFTWPKEYDIKIAEYAFISEYDLGLLKRGESFKTKPLTVGANSYKDWHELREHASGKILDREELVLASEITVNDGNPFVSSDFSLQFTEHKATNPIGKISIKVNDEVLESRLSEDINDKECQIDVVLKEDKAILDMNYLLEADGLSTKRVIFKKSDKAIDNHILKKSDLDVYRIDNGVIQFSCAPEFSASIFSLQHDNKEWLKTAFPTPRPFSWWNSWVGGISWRPFDLNLETMLEEVTTCEFEKKTDTLGNEWQGLVIQTEINKNKKHKGITWRQYYLTLPGVPVMLHYVEYKNTTQIYTKRKRFLNHTFFDMPETIGGSHLSYTDKNFRKQTVSSSNQGRNFKCDYNYTYKVDTHETGIRFYSNLDTSVRGLFSGPEKFGVWGFDSVSSKANQSTVTRPTFMIFGKEDLQDDWLNDFNNIKFK